jgi:nucleoside-diphosphate-sugar epimerase
MNTKVLIIGGTRFLGLAIAEPFIAKGYDVYEMNRGTRPPAKGVTEQIVCDKNNRETFAKVLKRYRWDIIIDTILNDEDLEFVISELGDNVGHFIHTGSLGVYADSKQIPFLESQPLKQFEKDRNEYTLFNNKVKQDQILMRAFNEKAFPATILRMSYIYGAGDSLLEGWGRRSAKFFHMLRDNEKIIIPNDGKNALIHPGHVKDLGRAFLHAAEHPESIGQIYNIGGSQTLTMEDYVAMIAAAMQVKPEIKYVSLDEFEKVYPEFVSLSMKFAFKHMCASTAKAERELNWRPEISLQAGIRENIEWMESQKII